MNSSNPAAMGGWIKAADPKSGRTYYANSVTRKTQWDAPDGWVEESFPAFTPPDDAPAEEEGPLPSSWEVMHDPTTGKAFYVDHKRKITQWTRPKVEQNPKQSFSHAPTATTSNSAAMARILQATTLSNASQQRSYTQEESYFRHAQPAAVGEVDMSDSMPVLDFSVKKVADKYRLECPHCDALFTLSKRRHHCRLCGDVFCDACSSHRVSLPLEGQEFEKPVRICDFCNQDVEQGNFFSMRRYLTPLTLFDPDNDEEDEDNGVATAGNVNAALAALTSDLDQMVQNAEGFEEKVTIPADILIPTIIKHLNQRSSTSERAVSALASLLSLGSIVGKTDFAHAVYLYGNSKSIDQILGILERSGSDRKTLFVQEKAAQAMCFLTDSHVTSSLVRKREEVMGSKSDVEELGTNDALDMQRCLRSMLDHSSMNKNPNLQRWSTATIRNLVMEDQRRACLAINEVAARVASGESPPSLEYESFLEQLVSTGGVMILCSLIGADDSDIRAHATGALGATLTATRAIDGAMTALSEMTGGAAGRTGKKDGDIVRAITAGGGCGASVSQLLLSADNTVAGMGCDFLASLVLPLLADPEGSATLTSRYDWRDDPGCLGACREAALEIASGSCLPALLSLVRENGRRTRPMSLRCVAMETFASTVSAVGEIGKAWAEGKYEEGLETSNAPALLTRAVGALNEENVIAVTLEVLKSSSMQSLGNQRDCPTARIREAAGTVLGSVTSCSAEAIMELHSRQVLSHLILAANDPTMTASSELRGDAAPRCLGMLEAAAAILMFAWRHPSGASSELLDRLIEALDAGAITHLFRVLTAKMDWESKDRSAGAMKARSAACNLICCLFGIALADETSIGMRRLMEACDADQSSRRSSRGPRNIMEAVLTVLQTSLTQSHKLLAGGPNPSVHYGAALLDLVKTTLLATGSMCGSSVAPGGLEGTMIRADQFLALRADGFETRRKEVCKVACDVVIRGGRTGPSLLPMILVGGFGEGAVGASLRLALAIAQNGSTEQHAKLANSGILVPVGDLLKSALTTGDLYSFSAALALVRFCGPHVAAGSSGGVQSVRDAIRVATNVLTLPVDPGAKPSQIETQEALKAECIRALESLSENAALWSAISTDALPSIVSYLDSSLKTRLAQSQTRSAALRSVLKIIQVPSHAVTAAEAGLTESLANMLKVCNRLHSQDETVGDDTLLLIFQVLHVLVSLPASRRHCDLLENDIVSSVCAAIGNSGTDQGFEDGSSAEVTFYGLEILHFVMSDVEAIGETPIVLQSMDANTLLTAVAKEHRFIRATCATLLKLTQSVTNGDSARSALVIDLEHISIYGRALPNSRRSCAGFESTDDAAAAFLFNTMVYACATDSSAGESFWKAALAQDTNYHHENDTDCKRAGATFAALSLWLMSEDYAPFCSRDPANKEDYENLRIPLARYRLLEALKDFLHEFTEVSVDGAHEIDSFITSVIVAFNVPCICLSTWRDPALLDLSYEVLRLVVDVDLDEIWGLFVGSKESILSLFEMLNLESSADTLIGVSDIRRFLASLLERLAESGALVEAVEKFGVKSSAIEALAAACLAEEEYNHEEDEVELTSNRLSSGLMNCLVQLCTVTSDSGTIIGLMELKPEEAESIAEQLGKKICQMVISRFLERAKMKQYDLEGVENVMDAPDIAMLCAIAQHRKALDILRSIGGFYALSQVAGEGEYSALEALKKGCEGNPSSLLEADTHLSILSLFSGERMADSPRRIEVESIAFELLTHLCSSSTKGRRAVTTASGFNECFSKAIALVSEAMSATERKVGSVKLVVMESDEHEASNDAPAHDKMPAEAAAGQGDRRQPTSAESRSWECALSFLASVIFEKTVLSSLLEDELFVRCCAVLALEGTPRLRVAAVETVVQLAWCAKSDSELSPEGVGNILLDCLAGEDVACTEGDRWDQQSLHVIAAEGLKYLYSSLSKEKQKTASSEMLKRYISVLKTRSLSKCTENTFQRLNAGKLAYYLSSTMLLSARTKLEDSMVTSLASLVQWRFDPKTVIAEDELVYWDATTTQTLQLLSQYLGEAKRNLESTGMSQCRRLKSNTWMVARAGKAPRKAISFTDALEHARSKGDASGRLAAEAVRQFLSQDH